MRSPLRDQHIDTQETEDRKEAPGMSTYTGLGLMSGTSLDGLDLCVAEFTGDEQTDVWGYRVLESSTVPYDDHWRARLASALTLSGLELVKLHLDFGHFMGKAVTKFLRDHDRTKLDFVASHGHTVFHEPGQGLTFQLGEGETLATYLQCPLITNFRTKDVGLGGQGAPLAPSGERFLYGNVGLCVNLGGIANVGVRDGPAWDVCACNSVINTLAARHDPAATFDKDGQLASQGVILPEVLASLEDLPYYRQQRPKSLGAEWINANLWPILDGAEHSPQDLARTYAEHVSLRIAAACLEGASTQRPSARLEPSTTQASQEGASSQRPSARLEPSTASSLPTPAPRHGHSRVLITGGGAHNTLLMSLVRQRLEEAGLQLENTDHETVDFKEAIVFAYLGLRCLMGKENVFASTTGAREDCIAGTIHQPALKNPAATCMYSHFRFLLRRQSSFS